MLHMYYMLHSPLILTLLKTVHVIRIIISLLLLLQALVTMSLWLFPLVTARLRIIISESQTSMPSFHGDTGKARSRPSAPMVM